MEVIVDIRKNVYREIVVRCSECRFYEKKDDVPSKCLRTLNDVDPEDFCSWGESVDN